MLAVLMRPVPVEWREAESGDLGALFLTRTRDQSYDSATGVSCRRNFAG
jgi:hypothetical protein